MSIHPAIIKEFRHIVGDAQLFDSLEKRIVYASDASRQTGELPDLILRPTETDQVARLLGLANENKIPVYARGAGSGLTGGAAPVRGGIVVDFELMNKILLVDSANMTALVQPGVVVADLQKSAESKGLFYPPDPASSDFCTIGGNVAENSGGLRGTKYGSTRNYILALEVVLASGEVIHTGSAAPKSVTGYDLVGLFAGSEGTLGLFTEILLRLVPLPEHVETVMAQFQKAEHAMTAVSEMFARGLVLRAAELMDEKAVECVSRYKELESLPSEGFVCLFEVDGPRHLTEAQAEAVIQTCVKNNSSVARKAASESEREKFWSLRKAISPALYQFGRIKLNEDICVPRSRLAEMVDKIEEIADRHSLLIVNFGHIGDGSLHVNVMLEHDDENLRRKADKAVSEIFSAAIAFGGTLSAEHGIGLTKAQYLGLEVGQKELTVMTTIKKSLDPNGILNPGKFLDVRAGE
jgi:glycolate oxidase